MLGLERQTKEKARERQKRAKAKEMRPTNTQMRLQIDLEIGLDLTSSLLMMIDRRLKRSRKRDRTARRSEVERSRNIDTMMLRRSRSVFMSADRHEIPEKNLGRTEAGQGCHWKRRVEEGWGLDVAGRRPGGRRRFRRRWSRAHGI